MRDGAERNDRTFILAALKLYVTVRSSVVFHFDKFKLVESWSPMDTESPDGTELVPLTTDNHRRDVAEVTQAFNATVSSSCCLKRIYRMQNIDLWSRIQA